ncbi:gluconokinase [Inquilinus sp. NPDC058860]|uniref:gluconokinase n=1 Tax=Inquilinus sp. NPDC058860 TaxID=3346652 RepID=UPI0036ABEAC2
MAAADATQPSDSGRGGAPGVVIVMGVSGSGKTTIGRQLARRMAGVFADADSFHPPANIEKMKAGHPLTDDDRWPWLDAMAAQIGQWLADGQPAVLACSALKRVYRDRLVGHQPEGGRPGVAFLYLSGSEAVIAARLANRKGHFMPPALLRSQFETLEPPGDGERVVTVDIRHPPRRIVDIAARRLGLGAQASRATDGA